MKRQLVLIRCGLMALCLGAFGTIPLNAQTRTNDWAFDAGAGFWAASVDGRIGAPRSRNRAIEANLEGSAGDVFSDPDWGGSLFLRGRYRSFGLSFDATYLSASRHEISPDTKFPDLFTQTTILDSQIAFGTLALNYQLPLKQSKFKGLVLAGVRGWFVQNEIDITVDDIERAPRQGEGCEHWFDPVVGIGAQYFVHPKWHLSLYGDVGGFGVSSDLTWSVYGGVGFNFSKTVYVEAGYRYLMDDYQDGPFIFDVTMQGFLLGIGVRF